MPVIELGEFQSGAIPGNAVFRVAAVMYFPNDEVARTAFLANREANVLAQYEQAREEVPPDSQVRQRIESAYWERLNEGFLKQGAFRGLLEFPGIDRTMRRAGPDAAVAADMLLLILGTQEAFPGKASVNKATYVIQKRRKQQKYHGGKPLPASKSAIMMAWRRFKPVAHLWAANVLFELDVKTDKQALHTTIGHFLAVAEELHKRAASIYPHGQRNHVLNPADTWRVSSDLDLPKVSIEIPAVPADVQSLIREYKAT